MNKIARSWEYQSLVKFLKKHKRYNLLVKFKNTTRLNNIFAYRGNFIRFLSGEKRSAYGIADLIIDFYQLVLNGDNNRQERLISSQLWRFYLLEELDKINESTTNLLHLKEDYVKIIRGRISHNGTRNNEEIENLFNKYNIPKYKN